VPPSRDRLYLGCIAEDRPRFIGVSLLMERMEDHTTLHCTDRDRSRSLPDDHMRQGNSAGLLDGLVKNGINLVAEVSIRGRDNSCRRSWSDPPILYHQVFEPG
jgi:hypothetical protein